MTCPTLTADQLAAELRYPGLDRTGELWRTPPRHIAHVAEPTRPGCRPLIAVLGSSGFKGGWQAGVGAVLHDVAEPVRWDLASGGTIPGLAAAAGIARPWQRVMNAGAPTHLALAPAEGLRWFERKNLDLGGVFELSAVEEWLAAWLAWAGVRTFADLRYSDGQVRPAGVQYRAGICVSLWRTRQPWPQRCSAEQLRDPSFIHKAFRWAFFGKQFPFRQFQQAWIPDTVPEHLPWLADEIDTHSPATWARVSMSQWPACVPMVLQDPRSRQLVFLTDGGHIDNQPSLFNDGRLPTLPLLNLRLQQNPRQGSERQREVDARRFPAGLVLRFPRTPQTRWGPLEGHDLSWADRDAMWRTGIEQAQPVLPEQVSGLIVNESQGDPLVRDVPALHGFQLIAAARRPHTRRVFALRS